MTNAPAVPAPPSDDELAFGTADLPDPPAVDAAPAKAEVRWLTDKPRIGSHPLAYPFAIDGLEIRTITIKRLTGGEVAAFVDRMRNDQGSRRFPLYFVGDVEMSDAIWEALDDDDRFALEEIAADFLPARFRPPTAGPAS